MVDVRITLSGLWVAVMLTYLLGDVLRIFAGHATPGEIQGKPMGQGAWLAIAVIMLVPIVMLVLSLTLPFPAVRWVTLAAAVASVLFNLAGLPYEGAYDNFLIAVSVVFCGMIAWYAWSWTATP
ncbi:MAG: DUF6326 family protein [Coriobacteriia bacterium]|nr:DUF6326 family protein [Coriobacteriia bacterium]